MKYCAIEYIRCCIVKMVLMEIFCTKTNKKIKIFIESGEKKVFWITYYWETLVSGVMDKIRNVISSNVLNFLWTIFISLFHSYPIFLNILIDLCVEYLNYRHFEEKNKFPRRKMYVFNQKLELTSKWLSNVPPRSYWIYSKNSLVETQE